MIDLSAPWPLGLSRRTWPWFAVGFVVLLAVLLPFDRPLSVFAASQKPDVVSFMAQLTRWGEPDWLLIPSLALLVVSAALAFVVPRRMIKLALIETIAMYALIFVGVGLPSLVANVLKRLIGRGRPFTFDNGGLLQFHPVVNGFAYQSYPSGHTTTAFAAAMVLGFLAPRWFGLALLYAVGVGASRLVLDAHYPTDVVSGAVLGTLGAYGVRYVFAKRGWGFKPQPDGQIVARPAIAITRILPRIQRRAAR